MPWTFSHPIAVVPLRRFCPERLNFAALVIGSLSPDIGYYIRQFPLAKFAHTIPGTFAVCLPAGLLMLGLFLFLRRPLCFMLPRPHRDALMPLALSRSNFSLSGFLIMAISVLLGAWTHTVWDSFTHAGAWTVERFAILRAPVISIGTTALPVSYFLQQISTFGATALLVILHFRWLRRQSAPDPAGVETLSDHRRYGMLALLAVIAIACALPGAFQVASRFDGYVAVRAFVFRMAVYSAATFIPLLVLTSVVLYLIVHRRANAFTSVEESR